jgi:anti-sigma factor RsiW
MNSCCNNDFGHDLDWMAFQYVADELSPADRTVFEDRLAHDLHACEAVARVTQTLHLTASALAVAVPVVASPSAQGSALSPRPALSPQTVSPRFSTRSLVTIAATVVVAMGLWWQFVTVADRELAARERAKQIVSAWAAAAPDSREEPVLAVPDSGDDVESDLSVPAWMLKAVAQTDEEGEPEMEEN